MPDHPYNNIWAVDMDSPYEAHSHAISEFLHTCKTPYQKMDVVITGGYGKALLLDGRIQSSQRDEYIYHESLVHPAMVAGGSPENVLIIGGGEGATLREVLKYQSVKKAVMIDIDREVVEACKEHLVEFHQGSFDDPRSEVVIYDGREFIKNTKERYDVVMIDISEPTEGGPAYLLYTVEFYELVRNIMKKGGRVVTQACTSSISLAHNFSVICNTMKKVFGAVWPYQCFVPSFGYTWGFSLWTGGKIDMLTLGVDERLSKRGISGLKFYDGITHVSLFSLPKDLRELLSSEKSVFIDESPPHLF